MELRRLEFFELVLPACQNTYGVAPCTAVVGVSGEYKCYQSPATCQSQAQYLAGEQVVRWAVPTEDLPVDYDYIPSIKNISTRAQQINPGESLGTRESITASFANHCHNDVGFDRYLETRGFNPFNVGTFWGKFIARWPNILGYECRRVRGFVGQTLDEMERYYYAVESTTGQDNGGNFSITAKDALKFLDGDKAIAPLVSNGVLLFPITDIATTLTLTPSGVGDLEYPVAGVASMGDEKVTFTRVGDVITLTGRGLNNSKLGEHKDGETFQLALVFNGAEPSQIIYKLLNDYTDTPTEYLDLSTWQFETTTHIGRLYSAEIMKPTSVKKLMDEIIQQVGLVVYTNTKSKKIIVKALRNLVPVLGVSDNTMIAGSITSKFESDKRISSVMLFYAQKNPLENIDAEKNYNAIINSFYADPVAAIENSPAAIKKIFSRWITVFNRPAAESVCNFLLKRYGRTPRTVGFKLPVTIDIEPGSVFTVQSRQFEDAQGNAAAAIPFQAISVEPTDSGCTVLGEEISSGAQLPDNGIAVVNIDQNSFNLNLRDVYNAIYLPPIAGHEVHFVIAAGVFLGSLSSWQFSVDVGYWPAGVIVKMMSEAGTLRIEGKGGDGGIATYDQSGYPYDGRDGGGALYVRYPIEIVGDVEIWGGGGGGGGTLFGGTHVPGGGGAGFTPGLPVATTEHGGAGSLAMTRGGDPGMDGSTANSAGGKGGVAIDGMSFITFTGTPNIRGAHIN